MLMGSWWDPLWDVVGMESAGPRDESRERGARMGRGWDPGRSRKRGTWAGLSNPFRLQINDNAVVDHQRFDDPNISCLMQKRRSSLSTAEFARRQSAGVLT